MKTKTLLFALLLCLHTVVFAHQGALKYLANEAVLVTLDDKKVLFDPFFHQNFATYQLVPEQLKQQIFAGLAPFDNIAAVVISHAHDDHFSATEVLEYLQTFPQTQLIAPQQAVEQITALAESQSVRSQLKPVMLDFKQAAKSIEHAGLLFEAVRIPHAGWPSRAEVENLVFRVSLQSPSKQLTVMHLGDADVDIDHYLVHQAHWQQRESQSALVPYWFLYSAEGKDILHQVLNAQSSIGIHVPIKVPKVLSQSNADYFSKPGETRVLGNTHQH